MVIGAVVFEQSVTGLIAAVAVMHSTLLEGPYVPPVSSRLLSSIFEFLTAVCRFAYVLSSSVGSNIISTAVRSINALDCWRDFCCLGFMFDDMVGVDGECSVGITLAALKKLKDDVRFGSD